MKNHDQADAGAHLQTNLDRVSHALKSKVVESDRMLDAYKVGAIDIEALKRKMDEIRKEIAELEGKKSRLERELHKAGSQKLNEEKLYQFCQDLPTTLANLAFEDKKQILQEVVDKIIVNGDEVTIYGIIPTPDEIMGDMSIELPSSSRHITTFP